ncbi:MAG: helix-turn-helix transcriptional regulator [Clostridia bacterium]|nr:helix-turn-helix transcriptional regulator [Clostridia bacterium]
MSIFGDRIRGLREDKDLNQTQLANILNCTQKKISRMETGENEPNLQDIKALCTYFNISANYLLGLTDNPEKLR